MYINYKTKTDILLEDIKGKDEKEYIDYLIHNRTQLTNQITRHLEKLQKKLDIAVKALKHMEKFPAYYHDYTGPAARQALKEIDLVGTSVSLAKEEE